MVDKTAGKDLFHGRAKGHIKCVMN